MLSRVTLRLCVSDIIPDGAGQGKAGGKWTGGGNHHHKTITTRAIVVDLSMPTTTAGTGSVYHISATPGVCFLETTPASCQPPTTLALVRQNIFSTVSSGVLGNQTLHIQKALPRGGRGGGGGGVHTHVLHDSSRTLTTGLWAFVLRQHSTGSA